MTEPQVMPQPQMSVTRGAPTDEELAAVLAIMTVLAKAAPDEEHANDIHAWNSKERMFRHFPIPGPGAWRASGMAQ